MLLLLLLCSCNVRVRHPHAAVFSAVEPLMRGDTTRTGFFTNTSLFDAKYQDIHYRTKLGDVFVKNDTTQNVLVCRYDTATMQPIWVQTAGGKGGDGGLNYYTVPPENAVYVVGIFEGTAYFPRHPGSSMYDSVVSRGMADIFIAKYSYDTGALVWVRSGGSKYSDVVFTYNGIRHTETLMAVDTAVVTVYANFFGSATFGCLSIDAKLTGSAVQISYDKISGDVREVSFVQELPTFGMGNKQFGRK